MNAKDVEMEMRALVEKYDLEGIVMIVGDEDSLEIGLDVQSTRFHNALPIMAGRMLEEANNIKPFDDDNG